MDLKRTVVLVALSAASTPAAACYEPYAPSCASDYSEFADEDEFDSCRSEMESYRSDVELFISCQNNEIEDLQSQIEDLQNKARRVVSDYESAVSSFNSRARY